MGAVCSGSMLFASILYLSVMLGSYLQQKTSVDDIFRCIFYLGLKCLIPVLRMKKFHFSTFMILFVRFDSLLPSQQYFNHVLKGLPGFNQ